MRNKIILFTAMILALTTSFNPLVAQSDPSVDRIVKSHYNKGVELYDHEQYTAAGEEFDKVLRAVSVDDAGYTMRAKFYIAQCAAKTKSSNAPELLERFVFEYPNSIYVNDINLALGALLHDTGEYKKAYETLLAVNPFGLRRAQSDEYNFRLGYCAYMCGDVDKALIYMSKCTTDPLYLPHATYYIAYINYSRGNMTAAKRGFNTIANTAAYEPIVPFYLLQIEFMERNFQYVVENGVPLLAKATPGRKAEICRIVSEAFFHQKDYASALKYIEEYEALGGNMGREELYLAGFCNNNQALYTKSAMQLASVATTNDILGQNAAFHLADDYLKLGDKKRAMNAFALAAGTDFNAEIKEESMFNYGKLQYEQGGGAFNEAITTLAAYVSNFPTSPRINEARELLLAAYFNSRNYEAAYDAILLIKDPDNNIKTALQKIAYFRALEFFEAGDYPQALELFSIADANRFNPKYTALTKFWRAEAFVKQGNYEIAAPLYREYITLSPRNEYESMVANYNLAYCYFNAQNWSEATSWFGKFTNLYKTRDDMLADAYNRMGDVAFAKREYADATADYNKAISLGTQSANYALYQRAIMLGLSNNRSGKIEALLNIISKNSGDYVDDAMFELGRTYVQSDRFTEGATALKNLITRFPDSPFALSALSELGLTYQNLGNNNEALRYYKMVVDKYPTSPQAKDAMLGIRNIYVDMNDVDSYFAYAKQSGIETNVTVVERDSLSFASAQRVYQGGDYSRALPLLESYIKQYPQGAYRAEALYSLGDCNLRRSDNAQALKFFDDVAAMPGTPYRTLALQQVARLQTNDKNFVAAAAAYKTLSSTATQTPAIVSALEGYMRSVIAQGDMGAMSEAADYVLASPFANEELTMQASFAKARALHTQNRSDEAMTLYRKIAPGRGAEAAESHFRIISILYDAKKFKEAEDEVFAFAQKNSSYQYWMGKSFLILGDIYLQQNDAFQAKATFQSIVDGYAVPDDGIIDEAKNKLSTIK